MLSELYKKIWFCSHLCSVCLTLRRFSVRSPLVSSEVDCVRLCAKIDYVHLWCEELKRFREFVRDVKLWPAPEPPWRWSPSWARSPPASGRGSPRSLTTHLQVPLPGIPLQDLVIRVTLRSGLRHLPSQFISLSVVFQLNLHLWSWTASSSACWGRFPCPGTPPGSPALRAKMVKATSLRRLMKNVLNCFGFYFEGKFESQGPLLMIKHTKCQISWEVDSSCLFND